MKRIIRNEIKKAFGWKTNRKLVIFESDDWGTIRMPSKEAFQYLRKQGLILEAGDSERYNKNDSLESEEDLSALFSLLHGFKDSNGKSAIFTAVSNIANPDFERIIKNNYERYFYEPVSETFKRYQKCTNSFDLWHQGITGNVFLPQYHGREHLNIVSWLTALREDDRHTKIAFRKEMWGFKHSDMNSKYQYFQEAYNFFDRADLLIHQEILKDGLDLFEKLLGYKADLFVPPNYIINNSLNYTLAKNGIKYISSERIQREIIGGGKSRIHIHWLGRKHKSGIRYITRNCFFEPSKLQNHCVDNCLKDIDSAFNSKKPAIISTHRVNYIGTLNSKNRDRGLRLLATLLGEIQKKWPESEFITTSQLGSLMDQRKELV